MPRFLVVSMALLTTFPLLAEPTERPRSMARFLEIDGRTRVIAHRGFSAEAPENTLVAIRRAIESRADMVEVDVTLSRDGRVILLHDETLDRTTTGTGRALDTSFRALRELDAGSWFASEFAGEKIPSLEEALELIRDRILLNIEIKGEAVTPELEGGLVARVLERIESKGLEEQTILSSFSPLALAQARQIAPRVHTASLFNADLHEGMAPLDIMTEVGSGSLNLSHRQISPEILESCHAAKRPVAVYTVNDRETMQRMLDLGVHAIFTDRPDVLRRLIAGR